MLKFVSRSAGLIPARLSPLLGDYVDTEQEMLHRRVRSTYFTRTKIDFDAIPELFAYTRQPEETIKHLWRHRKVAGVVRARDEFPELNLTHKARDVFDVYRDMETHNGTTQPYFLSIDDDSDYFKVTIEDVHIHEFYQHWPMFMAWNRFIPGRPNRMMMRVVVENWGESEAKLRGGRIEYKEDMVEVDVFTEEYPKVLRADMNEILPGKAYTVGHLEKDLPEGIQLSPNYKKRRNDPLYFVQKTLKSRIYWQYLKQDFDASKFLDVDLSLMGIELKKEKKEAQGTVVEGMFLSKSEEEKMQKLALMLGKNVEDVKRDIINARLKKSQEEAKKAKPPAKEEKKK
jgi:hypothetical protein